MAGTSGEDKVSVVGPASWSPGAVARCSQIVRLSHGVCKGFSLIRFFNQKTLKSDPGCCSDSLLPSTLVVLASSAILHPMGRLTIKSIFPMVKCDILKRGINFRCI